MWYYRDDGEQLLESEQTDSEFLIPEELLSGTTRDSLSLTEAGGGSFKRLSIKDVRYLAFEGGGGKGFVYVGAIRALQGLNILRFVNGRLDPNSQIKGIAGSSAGAITAMLLSLGYDANELERFMTSIQFNRFFDLPVTPALTPRLKGCISRPSNLITNNITRSLATSALPVTLPFGFIITALNKLTENIPDNAGPSAKFLAHPILYGESVISDFGIFSGCHCFNLFEELLRNRTGIANITFAQLFDFSRIKLVITGTNLVTGGVEYFSVTSTPRMPVATAVRISMSIPIGFKPVIISSQEANALGHPQLEGVWVDGGVKDNIPVRAFENEPGLRPHTFGLRLEIDKRVQITNLYEYLEALKNCFINSEGALSSTSGFLEQTITLETTGLSTINFNPSPQVSTPLVKKAETAVRKYFGINSSALNESESDDPDLFEDDTVNQPKRCTDITKLYKSDSYELFLQQAKKWIRTCVEEGRENELLDGNASLIAAWNEMIRTGSSSIDVKPVYSWERTSGPPYWRATSIRFEFSKQNPPPPPPPLIQYDTYYYCTGKSVKKLRVQRGITPTRPSDAISALFTDPNQAKQICMDSIPVPIPKPDPNYDYYYYCSLTGVKEIKVKKGITPIKPVDAKSKLYSDRFIAWANCLDSPIDFPWPPIVPPPPPGKRDDDDIDFGPLKSIFIFFGGMIFRREITAIVMAYYELRELYDLIESKYPGQRIKFHLTNDTTANRLRLLIEKEGKARYIWDFLDEMVNNKIISPGQYDKAIEMLIELETKFFNYKNDLTTRIVRGGNYFDRVRGYYIEDAYIEKHLWQQGYRALPNWFKAFDAFDANADYSFTFENGKYIAIFDNPGVISIKSHRPSGSLGLKGLDLTVLEGYFDNWIAKMNFDEFTREGIRITNPRARELHLILMGDNNRSEYEDKITALKALARRKRLRLKLFSYSEITHLFTAIT